MDDERPPEIFRGSWEECLRHFTQALEVANPPNSRGAMDARRPFAEFCGVIANTFTSWMTGRNKPVGPSLTKLMCLLDAMGYTVVELKKIPQGKRGFFELLGYGVLSVGDAVKLLGYKESSTMYQVLFGYSGTSE